MLDPRTAGMAVTWEPQHIHKGGFVIQHVVVFTQYRLEENGTIFRKYISNYWEAWKVDAKGVIYKGKEAVPEKAMPKGGPHDFFTLPLSTVKSSGEVEMIGYARYTENFDVNWGANVKEAGPNIPSTDERPEGWLDITAAEHGFVVAWDDFKGMARKIVKSWP
jgi:hypothetical protein